MARLRLRRHVSPVGLRVYVVEDYAPLVERLREQLAEVGATVVGHANSSEDALRDIASLSPDVILTDIALREGSGFDLLRGLSSLRQPAGQWRIVFTHDCSSYHRDAAARFGATHFFDKQWDVAELIDTLASRAARQPRTPPESDDESSRTRDPRSEGRPRRPDDPQD